MKQGKQFYEFGPFRIEEHERLLRRGQEVVALRRSIDPMHVGHLYNI